MFRLGSVSWNVVSVIVFSHVAPLGRVTTTFSVFVRAFVQNRLMSFDCRSPATRFWGTCDEIDCEYVLIATLAGGTFAPLMDHWYVRPAIPAGVTTAEYLSSTATFLGSTPLPVISTLQLHKFGL